MSSSKSRRAVRPYVRKGLVKSGDAGVRSVGAAARLAQAAGSGWGAGKASVEALEPRKLLFSLTIDPATVDPTTGLGTARAVFGYVIPYFIRSVPDPVDPTVVVEEFADESAPWTENLPAIPPNGTFFDDSNIQVSYSNAGALLELIPGPDPGADDDLDLRVRLTGNGFVTFTFFNENAQNPGLELVQTAQITIHELDTTVTGTKVELLRDGQVVQTYSGAALAALGTPQQGGGIRFQFNYSDGFNAVRFSSAQVPPDNQGYIDQFIIDDISYTRPSARFAQFIEERIFGVDLRFTGPAGATVRVLDLYGRDMVQTIRLGIPPGGELPIVAPLGTAVPRFNDGIGQIIITGTDERSSLTMWGGVIRAVTDVPEDATWVENGFAFIPPSQIAGLYDEFESAGFGYALSREVPPRPMGLPEAGGSIIIGSPIVRNNANDAEYLGPGIVMGTELYTTFNGLVRGQEISNDSLYRRADQGIRVEGGASIGSVLLHAVLHGSSRFTGAVGRLSVGTLLGSITIDGDVQSITIATDAGHWAREDTPDTAAAVPYADEIFDTRNEIIVGRTIGELAVAGRSTVDVTVMGDINNPGRARWDFLHYREREQVYGANFGFGDNAQFGTEQDLINLTLAANEFAAAEGALLGIAGQATPFGAGHFRNDSILSAEYVGHNATAVIIEGMLGQNDVANPGFEPVDVYAFAAGPDTEVVVDVIFDYATFAGLDLSTGLQSRAYARIVDADGRTIAAHEASTRSDLRLNPNNGVRLTFRPDHADVFYLVLNTPVDGAYTDRPIGYQVTLTGMLPTTFGSYRSGNSTGYAPGGRFGNPASITVQSGSMGLVRVGSGYVDGSGAEVNGSDVINTVEDDDDLMSLRPSSFNIAGHLHGVMLGSDVYGMRQDGSPGPQIIVGGNMGAFRTGMSPVIDPGPGEGDVEDLNLVVGGTLAIFDVRGAIRLDQDNNIFVGDDRAVNIRTGNAGGPGHIGQILVGQQIYGQNFNVRTSPGSIIDMFIVGESGADPSGDGGGGVGDINELPPFFNLGPGSDIRFVSFTRIETSNDDDAFRPLTAGVPVTLTDDTGAVITIEIRGGSPASSGQVRTLPINGSQGVAIARIDATLLGGAALVINGVTPGRASIGRIVVTTDDEGARSSIQIGGNTEIDVLRIDHVEGQALTLIQNLTVGGDIVAMDVQGLDELIIRNGNLGRTEVSGVGPRLLGPILGVASGYQNEAGGALGLNPNSVNPNWNGALYPAINVRSSDVPGDMTLSDIGGPFGPRLNGIVVRNGDVQRVNVAGAVGDVILQGGNLINLTANTDNVRRNAGDFDGIVGVIYANDIVNIDVGDGVAGPGSGPLAAAGIFADDDIVNLTAGRMLSPVIRGVIIAANVDPTDAGDNGISRIAVTNGRIDGAFIGASTFDSFWTSARFFFNTPDADDELARGDIVNLRANGTPLFRSEVLGVNIGNITITGAAYDATRVRATANIDQISAAEFRNSTRLGEVLEFRPNEIRATRNIRNITAGTGQGDISDLRIDAQGSLTGGLFGRNIVRTDLDIDGEVRAVTAGGDLRASAVRAGVIRQISAAGSIRSSSFLAAGRIDSITAGDNMTSVKIASDGPNGGIGLIQSAFFLTGEISSQGPIGSIISTLGTIIAEVRTTDAENGTLTLLQAAQDAIVKLDVASHVDRIIAGRNIGAQGDENTSRAINVRGNLNIIQANTGQIYTDVRVGQGLNLVQQARVVALPGNDLVSRAVIHAFGRINTVNIFGDFNGSIISESGGIGTVTITDGSFRPGNRIQANDGGIDQVIIIGGHLMGDIISEEHIHAVRVLPNAVGFWGDIGVNPNLSNAIPFDSMRNQLPPGVGPVPTFQGPRIQAGTNIGLVEVAMASMWESSIYAGHSITRVFVAGVILNDHITPGLGGSWIVAGDSIGTVEVGGFVGGAFILAGVTSLGSDNLPGGVGSAADTVQFGRIGDIIIHGGTGLVTIAAGMNAGPDGFYTLNPGPDGIRGTEDDINDDAVADGISSINSVQVGGAALQTTVYADNGIGFTTPGIIRGGPGLKQQNPGRVLEIIDVPAGVELAQNTPFAFQTAAGETGRITFSGPGRAFWDAETQTLGLVNTTLASSIIVDTDQNSLTDVRIVSNDGASMGFASIRANLKGNSSFYFDAYVQFAEFGFLDTTGVIGAGNDMGTLVVGPTSRGTIRANYISQTFVGGDFGRPEAVGLSVIDLLAGGNITIGGDLSGIVTLKRDANALAVAGAIERGVVRSGRGLSNVSAGSMINARISARNDISVITIAGDMVDSLIYAGVDIGPDGIIGSADDYVSAGNIATVTIGGNFVRSDIAAGIARGPDGFLGTSDDKRSDGRSSIGSVTIAGQAIGSEFNTESYRIIGTGAIGTVTAGGRPLTSNGNLAVTRFDSAADPLQVMDLSVVYEAGFYVATLQFNQPVDSSTISPALRIAEVRNGGAQLISLAEGTDYFVEYLPASNSARIMFSRDLTSRDLPQVPGVPGPGVYRFELLADVIRGQTQGTTIDGNGDGFAAPGDNFSQDAIVGDAGDKITGNVAVGRNGHLINFYGATDLNLVLDNNYSPDGLPDANKTFTIRGFLGDHPDHDPDAFRFAGDADVYKINLRAGQILRLGEMTGNAALAARALYDAEGNLLLSSEGIDPFRVIGTDNDKFVRLDRNVPARDSISNEDQVLIKQTGTYYILVTSTLDPGKLGFANELPDITASTQIPDIEPIAGATGNYSFTLEVFDDGDTGFSGDTDSGDGVRVVPAPLPIAFAGSDGVFGTSDDLPVVTIGAYTFGHDWGPDGVPNTADDLVSGSNGSGITSQRTAGADGVFGTADDYNVSFVGASIGKANATGVPREITPDIDVYHLNNREPIAPGTRIRATLHLTELGSNLGVTQQPRLGEDRDTVVDLRNDFQFAIFETSSSTRIDDGLLLAAPTEALPIGGQAQKVFSRGDTSYGYDANGDFFIEFIVPGRQGIQGAVPASYAIYIQGAIRTDYELSIVTSGTGSFEPTTQNVFIETRGGVIDWLEVGGVRTELAPFTASVLGFSGLIGGQTVDNYIISRLVSNLDAIFAAANVNVRFSTTSSSFEGQEFSTVFITRSNEPTAFALNGTFGVSQHVDAFNVDRSDQAVVFAPSLSVLGYGPSQQGVDMLVQSLTAAVARRVGELIGLRTLDDAGPGSVMAANSVRNVASTYRFNSTSAALTNNWDSLYNSHFYLGRQNDMNLLDRILADRF